MTNRILENHRSRKIPPSKGEKAEETFRGILASSNRQIPRAFAPPPFKGEFVHCINSLKKLFPRCRCKPKFSAMVCPASAKLARVPKSIPFATAEPKASNGTYSREWSVDGVTGSQP